MAAHAANLPDPQEILSCGICVEPYDAGIHQAKFLSCHHTFCLGCLITISNEKQTNQPYIECPNCRSKTYLPGGRADGLQNNFYITSFQEFSERVEPQRTAANLRGCHGHPENPVTRFCVTCGIPLCRDCSTMEHMATRGHSVVSVTKEEASYLQELDASHKSVTQNKKNLQLIEFEMALLNAAKESAIKDMESFIQILRKQVTQHRKSLLNIILEQLNAKLDSLLEKQGQIQEVNEMLNKDIDQAKDITKTGNLRQLKQVSENLKKASEKTQSIAKNLDLGQNYLAFDPKGGSDEFNKFVRDLGQVYTKGFLPAKVAFESREATAGHTVTLTVEVYDHHGDEVPVSSDSFAVRVTDPTQTVLPSVLCTNGTKSSVTFIPQMGGLHEVSGLFLGQKLMNEETHISVSSNNPVSKFGRRGDGNGTFYAPWGIATDNEGCLYVADCCNRLIQKFTPDGEFLSQFSVNPHNKNITTVDMAIDQDKGLLYCMELLDEKHFMVNGKNILVFNLEGELQHSYTPGNISNAYYIAINTQGELIISDVEAECLLKVDTEGKFLGRFGNTLYPGYTAITEDDNIIVPDAWRDCVYILNPDGTVKLKFGSRGTGKGQLKQPWGVATDGEYILVSECENNRIQVFKYDGTCVSIIESSEDPFSQPRGLVVTKDGHVYVTDRNNHCVKKFKYRDMH